MRTTVTLNEQDITEAVALLLAKRGLTAKGKATFVVDDSDVGDPRGGGRAITVSVEAEPLGGSPQR